MKKKQMISYSFFTMFLIILSLSTQLMYTQASVNDHDIFIKNVKVKKHTTKKTYKNNKNKTVLTAKYSRPVLQSSFKSIKIINQFYEKDEKKWFKSLTSLIKEAKEYSKETNSSAYSSEIFYDITYNQQGYISILTTSYVYTGGAHGLPSFESHTFDLNTGKELKLTDIMKGTNQTIVKKIISAFEKEIKKDTSSFFSDALDVVKSSASINSPFYLMKNKICFYYDVYALAPYASGRTEAYISYKAKDTFKIKL